MLYGGRVAGQKWGAAIVQDLVSSPAVMKSFTYADSLGCVDGNCAQIVGAEQAYSQAYISGAEAWACLPPEERPVWWGTNPPTRASQFPVCCWPLCDRPTPERLGGGGRARV